jgi:hypothetical protein
MHCIEILEIYLEMNLWQWSHHPHHHCPEVTNHHLWTHSQHHWTPWNPNHKLVNKETILLRAQRLQPIAGSYALKQARPGRAAAKKDILSGSLNMLTWWDHGGCNSTEWHCPSNQVLCWDIFYLQSLWLNVLRTAGWRPPPYWISPLVSWAICLMCRKAWRIKLQIQHETYFTESKK